MDKIDSADLVFFFAVFISTHSPWFVGPGLSQAKASAPDHDSGLFFLATQGRVKHYLEARSEKLIRIRVVTPLDG